MRFSSLIHGAAALAVLSAAGLAGPAAAQEKFPTKPIQLIVAWPAGGGSDRILRLIADSLSKAMGSPAVVVNKPGAGGATGTREIATAKPDGYTIGMESIGFIARQYTNPNANEMKDLQPLAYIGADVGALSARAQTGFKTVADFVKAAKEKPGSIKNGNDQPGGSSYVAIAVMEKALGIKVTRVPYQGYAPTVAALLAGEVDTATVPVPDAIEQHKAGKIRILGVTDDRRHFMAPDVPTFKEQGFDVIFGSWRSMMAPRGIPKARLDWLEEKVMAALKDPEFVKRANAAGFDIAPKGSADTWKIWEESDKALYPILAEAGLVKARKKN